jgi:tetratricopeptide (TPR) repeat protein
VEEIMKARKLTLIIAAAITLYAQADITLEKATRKETLEGDLKGAIELYRKAFSEAKNDRTMAARALVRMAECYQKLGDDESRKIYEQVVREYGDQKEAVTTARARLGPPAVTGPVSRGIWKAGPSRDTIRWGTMSRDGRYFSYSHSRDVFLYDIATRQERNLTNQQKETNDTAYESVISPDGKQIAYNWWVRQTNRYELRMANLSGEPNARQLYANPEVRDLWLDDWSPDGKSIAVVLERYDRTRQIGLLSVSDRSLRVLKSGDWNSFDVNSVRFSPDSK